MCKSGLLNIKVDPRKHGGSVFQWISSSHGKQFGLAAEFSEIPQIAFDLLRSPVSASDEYDIIFFPSKTHARSFLRKIVKGVPNGTLVLGAPYEKPPDTSRYTVIILPETRKFCVLLNVAAVRESALNFLIAYFNGLFQHLKELSMANERNMYSITETILKCVRRYNSYYDIKFFVADEFIKLLANNWLAKLWWSYAENLTLKELSSDRSLSIDISSYISYKISAVFDLIRNTEFYSMIDLINLAGVHADALNIVFSLSENVHLFRIGLSKFERENKSIVMRISRKDVAMALNTFVQEMSDEALYRKYEDFGYAVCRNLTKFLSSLKPTYVWLEEAYSLAMPALSYQRQIEENLEPWVPQFGNIDDFTELLSKVFKKIDSYPELYPEIPLVAGYALLQLLEYLAEWRGKARYLNKSLKVGKKLALALDKMLPEIKQKNPETPFQKKDIATIYTGLARTCMKFGRKKEMIHLLGKAKLIAEKYNFPEIKCLVNWHEFILSQDYDKLLQVHNLHSSVSREFATFKPQFKTIAFLSGAVFEREDKFPQYMKAIDSSTELSSDSSLFDKTSTFHDLIESRILYYVTNLFLKIEETIKHKDTQKMMRTLKEARVYASALETEIGALFDPTWVFVLKTKLIDDLASEKIKEISQLIRRLERFSAASATTRNFLSIAKMWHSATKRHDWKAFLNTLDLPYESRDPWSILLAKIIETKSKQQLIEKLEQFPKAALFVEGPTEQAVIPLFAAKLGIDLPELGVGVVPLRGSSKGKYHLKFWKEVMERVTVSRYMLVDSHAKQEAEEAIKNGLIERSKCFVLKKHSIEDYYPVEVLLDVIHALCGRRPTEKDFAGDRVSNINAFLRKNGYTEDWKIIVGKKVAERIESDQLPEELEEILKKIRFTA